MLSQRLRDAFFKCHFFRVEDIPSVLDTLNKKRVPCGELDKSLLFKYPELDPNQKSIEQIDRENDALVEEIGGKIF